MVFPLGPADNWVLPDSKCAYFGYFFNKKSHYRWSFVTVLFYQVLCFQSSAVLKHVSILHSFVCWIVFHCTEIYIIFIHSLLMNICAIHIAMNIGVHAFCVDLCFLFLLSMYLGIELLNHTRIVYLTFWETIKQLSKNTALF